MNQPLDVITLLRQRSENGARAERHLAKVVLADVKWAAHAPIAEIAETAGVSEPTVTRLATRMGFRGTRDLKIQLAQALVIGGAFMDSIGETIDLGKSRAVLAVCRQAHNALNYIEQSVDEHKIERIANRFATADKIFIFGTGGISSFIAEELRFRLFRLGLNVTSENDAQIQRMNAALSTETTAVIGFSVSGNSPSVCDSLRIASEYGAETFSVTAPGSELFEQADLSIPFKYAEDGNYYKPSSTRFALLALGDIIALKTAEKVGPVALENMRRIKMSLTTANHNDPSMPLGD
ncbi:MAG: MurR/RpiR family transcriptional regulator [Cohaesibacteraceae bacterium]|nr:MurR/RpiR family transcriptional regulator [Cohaesibacteraceae bacterium]